jgi:cbb3-type cytochrome oxidase maturation protein
MNILLYLIPIALTLGLAGLVAFMWALRSGQFDDLDGAANRILFDDDEYPSRAPAPIVPAPALAPTPSLPAKDDKTDSPHRGG